MVKMSVDSSTWCYGGGGLEGVQLGVSGLGPGVCGVVAVVRVRVMWFLHVRCVPG